MLLQPAESGSQQAKNTQGRSVGVGLPIVHPVTQFAQKYTWFSNTKAGQKFVKDAMCVLDREDMTTKRAAWKAA